MPLRRVSNELSDSGDLWLCPWRMVKVWVTVAEPAYLTFLGGAFDVGRYSCGDLGEAK